MYEYSQYLLTVSSRCSRQMFQKQENNETPATRTEISTKRNPKVSPHEKNLNRQQKLLSMSTSISHFSSLFFFSFLSSFFSFSLVPFLCLVLPAKSTDRLFPTPTHLHTKDGISCQLHHRDPNKSNFGNSI